MAGPPDRRGSRLGRAAGPAVGSSERVARRAVGSSLGTTGGAGLSAVAPSAVEAPDTLRHSPDATPTSVPPGVTVHCWSVAPLHGSICTPTFRPVVEAVPCKQSPDAPPTTAPSDRRVQSSLAVPLQ